MISIHLLGLTLIAVLSSALAFDLQGKIHWNELCPNYRELGYTQVQLDNGRMFAGVTVDGSFLIPDVPQGIYVLSVLSHNHTFDQLRVDVIDAEEGPTVEIRPYIIGTPLNPPSPILLNYPISLSAKLRNNYFIPREGFNVMAMFQNPMMLMMVFAGVMMIGMPYLMKNMDPDMMQEYNQQQAKVAGIHSSLASGDIRSGLSALLNADDEKPAASSSVKPHASASTQNRKGGKNKKR